MCRTVQSSLLWSHRSIPNVDVVLHHHRFPRQRQGISAAVGTALECEYDNPTQA